MIVYNTDATTGVGIYVWDGKDWIKPCAPPAPGPITFSGTSFCGASVFTAKIDSVKGATKYVWTLPTGLTGTSNDTIITISGAVGTYAADSITVRAVSSCGGGSRSVSAQTISIYEIPAEPTNASFNSGASGSSIVFSASVPIGYEIDWYDAATDGIKIRTGVNSFSETLTAKKTYYAESRNTTTGCVSATRLAVTGSIIIAGCDPLTAIPLITSANVQFINDATYTNSATYNTHPITLSAPVKIVGKSPKRSFAGTTSSIDYRDHQVSATNVTNDTDDYGSWFTWCMVVNYADILCPSPWRVPSLKDFQDYSGIESGNTKSIYGSVVGGSNIHGWLLGGYVSGGSVGALGTRGFSWSSTPLGSNKGYTAHVNHAEFYPQGDQTRNYGFSLRCVR
jgi:uncharacterized protein (TIGR02145 family)